MTYCTLMFQELIHIRASKLYLGAADRLIEISTFQNEVVKLYENLYGIVDPNDSGGSITYFRSILK